MRRTLPALTVALALLGAACGSDGSDVVDGDSSQVADAAADQADADADEGGTDQGTDPDAEPATPDADAATDADAGDRGSDADPDDAGGPGGDGAATIAAAATASAETSSRFALLTVATTPTGEVRTRGEGTFDPSGDGRLVLTVDGAGAADLGVELPVELETLVVDGVTYQRFGPLLAQLGVDATWLSIDPTSARGEGLAGFGAPGGDVGAAESFSSLLGAEDVEVVGREDVLGVATTRYRATVDAAAALRDAPVDPGDPDAGVGERAVTDVWIDDDGLVRRLEQAVDVEGFVATTTFEVLEYGVEVDVVAPPAADVVSFEQLLSGQLGQG